MSCSECSPTAAAVSDEPAAAAEPTSEDFAHLQRTSTPALEDQWWRSHPLSPGSVASSTEDLSNISEEDEESIPLPPNNTVQEDSMAAQPPSETEVISQTSIRDHLASARDNVIARKTIRAKKELEPVEAAVQALHLENKKLNKNALHLANNFF